MGASALAKRPAPMPKACGLVRALLTLPTLAGAATLVVEVGGVQNDNGVVRVAVCTAETFATKRCRFTAAAPAQAGTVVIEVPNIEPGRYAVEAFHDEDGRGRIQHGLFGIPTSPLGFSRDAPVRLGAPGFEDAALDVTEPSTTTHLKLRHLGF